VLLFREEKILLVRRAQAPRLGMWDFPGGFLKSGETAEDAVVREIYEELQLRITHLKYLTSVPDVYGSKGFPIINLIYTAVPVGEPVVDRSELESVEWFAPSAIPSEQIAFPHQVRVLKILAAARP